MKHKDTNKLMRVAMLLLVALFSLTGARAQETLPYEYGFENNDLADAGWTTSYQGTANASEFGINADAKQNGNYGFRFSSYSRDNVTYDQYLISPELNVETGVEVQFYYKASSSYGTETFKVGYSTTDTNLSSFTFGDEISTNSTSWAKYEEIFPKGTKYVAVFYFSDYQYRLYVDDFSFSVSNGLKKPTDLEVLYQSGTEATVRWTSTESAFDIEVNGVETSNITSNTYILTNLQYATTYSVRVRAKKNGEVSNWTDPVTFRTASSANSLMINYSLADSYGDGWNGNAIKVVDEDGNVIQSLTISSGNSNSGTLDLENGAHYEFVWVAGNYASECSWTFTDLGGNVLFSGTGDSNMATGDVLYEINPFTYDRPTDLVAGTPDTHSVELSWTANSTATSWQICLNGDVANAVAANSNPFTLTGLDADTEYSVKVRAYIDNDNKSGWSNVVTFTTAEASSKPTDLAESNITTTSATLSWSGTNDSYVVQYRPWNPAGDDIQTTGAMVTYTYDLSAFSGTGSFAIRHYDISDMFQLIVDNIVVKDAGGNVIFSEDFESCEGNMPAAFTNMDLDGDGFTWQIASTPSSNVDGTYGIVSESYNNDYGALTPDNWLIINGIEMGGSISFSARGQDPAYAAENFAVYISTESSIVEVPVTTTSYDATGLEPNTSYAWQVKGITGGEDSRWVSSFFKTLDDALVFTTAGDWDDINNWTDVNGDPATGLPTISNNVRVEADVTIPAGVIAQGKKITIADGASITIEDGGELKHSSATLRVTMEKEIAAGENNLIASPFSGRTLLDESGSFSRVDNLIDGSYDYYAFDPTQANEWINYEANPSYNPYFEADNGLNGLLYGEGYLYANDASCVLEFIGTTWASNNHVETKDFDYDATSTDSFNGWKLIGNPFTCTGYITYSEDATFYKLNAAGTGFDAYENAVALAPGEGAFMRVTASGTITYSSEPLSVEPVAAGSFFNLVLPAHGEETDQDADPSILIFADDADNTSDINAFNGQTVNVQLTGRTLYKDDSWNTICLPFDVTIAGSPLDGATVMELNTTSSSLTESTLTLSFTEVEAIEAGKPYLIKWASGTNLTEEDLVFNDVEIKKDLVPAVVGSNVITFSGNYAPVPFEADDKSILYVGANNQLYYPSANFSFNAFRAYFQVDDSSLIKHFALKFSGDDATAIETIANGQQTTEGAIYNVAGQRLNKAQKGVNIVNGKKILK